MKTTSRSPAVTVALVLAVGVAPLLGGCATSVEQAVSTSSAIPSADPVSGCGAVGADGSLPAGWPTTIPVIEGTVAFGVCNAAAGRWVITVTSSVTDPLGTARTQLEGAGFTTDTSVSAGGTGVVTLSDATYSVLLASNATGIVYTVTTLGP